MKSEIVTSAELTRRERITRGTLSTWVKKGCPVHRTMKDGAGHVTSRLFDVDKVRRWRLSRPNQGPSVRHNAGEVEPAAVPDNGGPASVDQQRVELENLAQALKAGDGVEGAILRLRVMERAAYQVYCNAVASRNAIDQQVRCKLHSDIVKYLLAAEALVDKRKELEAVIWSEVEQSLVAWSAPVKAMLDQMPRALASRCNVSDPSVAELALRDWVHTQLYPMMNRKPAKP